MGGAGRSRKKSTGCGTLSAAYRKSDPHTQKGSPSALGTVIVYDGESIWFEGVALIGLYGMVAASFWRG